MAPMISNRRCSSGLSLFNSRIRSRKSPAVTLYADGLEGLDPSRMRKGVLQPRYLHAEFLGEHLRPLTTVGLLPDILLLIRPISSQQTITSACVHHLSFLRIVTALTVAISTGILQAYDNIHSTINASY